MCEFFSAVVTRDQRVLFCEEDSHEVLIARAGLRDTWPRRRPKPWWKCFSRYQCDVCRDYGLILSEIACPGDGECGDIIPHGAHEFGWPCHCVKGARFRPPVKSADDFQQARKTTIWTRPITD